MPNSRYLAFVFFAVFWADIASAEYCAVGPIKGNVCKGALIKSCKLIRVHATSDADGPLKRIENCYDRVDFHDESKGECVIVTKSTSSVLVSIILNKLSPIKYYHMNTEGKFEKLDAQSLEFSCTRK